MKLSIKNFSWPSKGKQPKTAMLSELSRADARRQANDSTQWRDYHTFLLAKRTLLNARIAEARVAFEQADTLEVERRLAQSRLDRIPATTRTMFEAVVEERRRTILAEREAQTQRQVDPDTVDLQTLTELIDEAEGRVAHETVPLGHGFFPRGDSSSIRWFAVDVAELLSAPDEAAYTVAGTKDQANTQILKAAGAGLALIIFLVVWFVMPRGGTNVTAMDRVPLGINAAATALPLDIWPAQQVVLGQSDGKQITLKLTQTDQAEWGKVSDTLPGYWQHNAFHPVMLCIKRSLVEGAKGLTITGGGSWAARSYTLSTTQDGYTDLVLVACDRPATKRYGALQSFVPVESHAVGEVVTVSEQHMTVTALHLIGPGIDPSLPEGQGRVIVTVQSDDLDWPTYKPGLTVPNGQTFLPAETTTDEHGTTRLAYLVPLVNGSMPVAWDITPPNSVPLRWRVDLPPPVSRYDLVRDALAVLDLRIEDGQAVVIVTNRSASPLQILRSDITVVQRDRSMAPMLEGIERPIMPGEKREISITVPNGGNVQLTIGTQAYQID